VIATLLAIVFSTTPFAFVLCGVNCAHAIAEASEGHACHETESSPVGGTTVRGVPPPCTHVDADDESASRIEAFFTVTLPIDLVRTDIVNTVPVGWFVETDAIPSVAAPQTKALQLRV
jgi:hypothetical protein